MLKTVPGMKMGKGVKTNKKSWPPSIEEFDFSNVNLGAVIIEYLLMTK